MSADLILADFKSKTWVSDRSRQEADLRQQAIEIMNVALMGDPGPCIGETIPFGGQGIDGMWTDTAPSEYVAPLDDPA